VNKSILELKVQYIPILALILLGTTSAIAQSVPMGCYSKDYTEEHLARHPEQVVDRISVLFIHRDGRILADVQVLLADQGHAGRNSYGGARVSEFAVNPNNYDVSKRFSVDCDGGGFDVIEVDAESIVIETNGFRLSSNSCTNGLDDTSLPEVRTSLHEEGSPSTRYRLEQRGECDW
jgi:hypothetical protein